MLIDEENATSLPPLVLKMAFAATVFGLMLVVILGIAFRFDLIEQPLSQYLSMATVLLVFGGAGLIGVDSRMCTLRYYIIYMTVFALLCVFFVVNLCYPNL